MSNSDTNLPGLLRELISMSGWHDNFIEKNKAVPLYLHVNFNDGHFIGEKVQFAIKLHSALIALQISEAEPVKIPRRSVNRFSDKHTGTTTTTFQKATKKSGTHTLSLKPGLESTSENNASKTLGIAATGGNVNFDIQSISDGDSHRWQITPKSNTFLQGSPWQAASEALCTIKPTINPQRDGVGINIFFDAFISLDTLDPQDIQLKQKDGSYKPVKSKPNNIEAARAFLRNRFEQEGLQNPSFSKSKSLVRIGTHKVQGEDP